MVVGTLAVVALLSRGLWHWYVEMTTLGHRRSGAIAALPVVVLGGAALVLLVARARGWIRSGVFMVLFALVLVAELVAFARPIPTVVDRGERLVATESHGIVVATLEPGERLAGHRTSFYPSSTQIFGIEALGGQTLKSAGYRALIEAVAPTAFSVEGGGTAGYPALQLEVSPALPLWDALGVGVWAMQPSTPPPGPRIDPPDPMVRVDASGVELEGSVLVPEGGLRAVVFDSFMVHADGRLTVTVEVGDEVLETTVRRDEGTLDVAHLLVVTVAGEHLAGGETATVRARGSGTIGGLDLGVGADGRLVVGSVGGADDGLHVIGTGPVTLLERHRAAPFRLHDAATVEAEVAVAAGLVVARPDLAGAVVVDRAVGLPTVPDRAADLRVTAVEVEQSRMTVAVDTDRNALLVLPVADYPGWVATVDGVELETVTADAALLGVVVPAGVHTVDVRFEPDGLGLAVAVFVVTAVVAAGWWLGGGRGRRPVSAGSDRDFTTSDG